MKWVIDTSHRFEWRPFYDQAELDDECERTIVNFLNAKNQAAIFPISTDDLVVLIERDASDLDLYADLSGEGDDVEGRTEFFPNKKPSVKITRELTLDESKQHRLRTTLAHEYGHVRFHDFMWRLPSLRRPAAFPSALKISKKLTRQSHRLSQMRPAFSNRPGPTTASPEPGHESPLGTCFHCQSDFILDSPVTDWMEWQAAYAGGALLMPISALRRLILDILPEYSEGSGLSVDSETARRMVLQTATCFDVSLQAARVRLQKLAVLHTPG